MRLRGRRGVLDNVIFILVGALSVLFTLHGKAVSDSVFNDGPVATNRGFHHLWVYIVVVATAVLLGLCRAWTTSARVKSPVVLLLIFLGPAVVQRLSSGPSMMVFFLHLYLAGIAGAIVLAEEAFSNRMPRDFWKLFFEGAMKGVRYVLLLFTAGAAALQYVSTSKGEESMGFLTTLFYPAVVLVLSMAMVGQWILLPSWERLVASFKDSGDETGAARAD